MNCVAAEDFAPHCITAKLDNWELLIEAILGEASELNGIERSLLAARILALGGHEAVDGFERGSERARLAIRLAARLSDPAD
jgi:hypothetical protein